MTSHDAVKRLPAWDSVQRDSRPGADCHQASACRLLGVLACEPLIAMKAYQDVVRAAFAACWVAARLQSQEVHSVPGWAN